MSVNSSEKGSGAEYIPRRSFFVAKKDGRCGKMSQRPFDSVANGSLGYLFKIGCGVLADRADEAVGQFLSDILISADRAPPHRLPRRVGLRLGFDVGVIIGIGAGLLLREHRAVGDFGDEQVMRPQIEDVFDLCAEIAVRARRDERTAVGGGIPGIEILEFIGIPAAVEAETFEQFEFYGRIEYGYGEFSACEDAFGGIVCLIDRHGDLIGGRGYLGNGVDDTAGILHAVLVFGREHEESVAQIAHDFFVHLAFFSLSVLFFDLTISCLHCRFNFS